MQDKGRRKKHRNQRIVETPLAAASVGFSSELLDWRTDDGRGFKRLHPFKYNVCPLSMSMELLSLILQLAHTICLGVLVVMLARICKEMKK